MQYQVVTGKTPGELTDNVNALLQRGWFPQGGVAVLRNGLKVWCAQAMVLED